MENVWEKLTLLNSERPKLNRVLAILSAIGLRKRQGIAKRELSDNLVHMLVQSLKTAKINYYPKSLCIDVMCVYLHCLEEIRFVLHECDMVIKGMISVHQSSFAI